MRIAVHDFSGHPFQVQLARQLAGLGHTVRHSYCDRYVSGKGALTLGPDDSPTLSIEPVHGSREFDKYDPVRRARFEIAYGRDLERALTAEPVDAVVLCNVPLLAMWMVKVALRRKRIPFVFWHQDVYSMGMSDELARKFPTVLARPLGSVFTRMERACVRDADGVVAIDDVFCQKYRQWRLDTGHVELIPNWSPLDGVGPIGRDNAWSREVGQPVSALRLLYSGMLGRKHNPRLLLDLMRRLREAGRAVHLTVVSEGDGADALRAAVADGEPVTVLGFQPAERLGEMLSSADALIALLEPQASRFSIPSKVLSYVAAGRPVVGLMPNDNAAARVIDAVGGMTATPDAAGVERAARWLSELADEPTHAARLGIDARAYAEREFDIGRIGRQFGDLLARCAGPADGPRFRSAGSLVPE